LRHFDKKTITSIQVESGRLDEAGGGGIRGCEWSHPDLPPGTRNAKPRFWKAGADWPLTWAGRPGHVGRMALRPAQVANKKGHREPVAF